tara:strand:+ start:315 stop:617 length:303 start_codon:yes stop_codon:yes gene_type:complete
MTNQVNKISTLKTNVLNFLNKYNETNLPKASICFRSYDTPNMEKIYISDEMKNFDVKEILNMVRNECSGDRVSFIFDDASKDYQTQFQNYSYNIITIRSK